MMPQSMSIWGSVRLLYMEIHRLGKFSGIISIISLNRFPMPLTFFSLCLGIPKVKIFLYLVDHISLPLLWGWPL
jgi:hypothetical protein